MNDTKVVHVFMAKEERKVFVLDTSVLMYNHDSYKSFGNNDVVIPHQVLEELDSHKKGNETINYEARQVIREIDELSDRNVLTEWTQLNQNGGRLKIAFQAKKTSIDAVDRFGGDDKGDHKILNTALYIKEFENDNVVLVTKDVNLRVKAKALGLPTKDYTIGLKKDIEKSNTGKFILEGVDPGLIDMLYKNGSLDIGMLNECSGLPEKKDDLINAYFIIKNGKKSVLAYYNSENNSLEVVSKENAMNIKPRNSEQIFALHAMLKSNAKIIVLGGAAGTGKTLLAVAAALEQSSEFEEIHIARPIVALNNKEIGYLPGTVDSKIGPYMNPIWDNLKYIKSQSVLCDKKGNKPKPIDDEELKDKLIVEPLAYIRGRSLSNILFIVDEAQNLSPLEIKTIISRMGDNSKIVFTGDVQQIDNQFLTSETCGLSYVIEKLHGEKLFCNITLEKGERSDIATLAAEKL